MITAALSAARTTGVLTNPPPAQANLANTGISVGTGTVVAIAAIAVAWYVIKHRGAKKSHVFVGIAVGIAIAGGTVGALFHELGNTGVTTASSLVNGFGGADSQVTPNTGP